MTSNYTKGFYLLLMNSDNAIKHITANFKTSAILNLDVEKAYRVQQFVKERKLKLVQEVLVTASEFPISALTASIELVKENEVVFIGTYGMGYDTIVHSYTELYKRYADQEKTIFLCHHKQNTASEPEIFPINGIPSDQLLSLLKKDRLILFVNFKRLINTFYSL